MAAEPMTFGDFVELAGVPMDDGSMVSAKAVRLVEIIRDYDPLLEVEWIPREHRLEGDSAIRIVDTRQHGLARVVMSFRDEGEFTQRDGAWVLERLFLADHSKSDPVARMEAGNAAAEILRAKRAYEERQEGLDLMKHALASPLHRYSFRTREGERKVVE